MLDYIHKLSLFEGLDAATQAKVAAEFTVQNVARGSVVIERGAMTSDVFFVLTGELMGVLVSSEGKEVAVATLQTGACFGEMAAIDGGPRSLSVQAAQDCVIGRLSAAQFNTLLSDYPEIAQNLLRDLVDRIRTMNARVFELVVHDLETRIRLMLVRLLMEASQLRDDGLLDPAPSHTMIAAHVGANREAVSRILSKLSKAGVLRTGRRRITVLNAEALLKGL